MRIFLAALFLLAASATTHAASPPPNIVLIMADDLGYGDLGCYGQKKIQTPHVDRLAKEGIRFTHFYAGNAVCATSRCVLMTGKHTGHCVVRTNREVKPEGQFPLPATEQTLPELLRERGYATGAIGKWGLGPPGSSGDPLKQGFDFFYGYNCQRHAHNHYPKYLYRNDQREALEGNTAGLTGKHYSHDLFEKEALAFIEQQREKPFFLYLPFTIPHLALQVPEDSLEQYTGHWEDPAYDGKNAYLPHKHPRAAYAAMITRMDRTVGRILDLLEKLQLDNNTLVLFTSDNGPAYDRLGGSDSDFFASNGGLRGFKGSLYEGGIRVPLVARWPGKIAPGSTSDLACASYDLLPTLCELAGAKAPADIDGISLVPTVQGQESQAKHEVLYFEFPSYGGQQAVLLDGRYKAVRQKMSKGNLEIELYDLMVDRSESKNVAAAQPALVKRAEEAFVREHVPSADFPLPGVDK